jgi:hypothetical protein
MLQAITRSKVDPSSVIHTERWRGYYGLLDIGVDGHFRVNHDNNEDVKGRKYANGVKYF